MTRATQILPLILLTACARAVRPGAVPVQEAGVDVAAPVDATRDAADDVALDAGSDVPCTSATCSLAACGAIAVAHDCVARCARPPIVRAWSCPSVTCCPIQFPDGDVVQLEDICCQFCSRFCPTEGEFECVLEADFYPLNDAMGLCGLQAVDRD